MNIPNIIQAVKETGATAVHPGYGFLSENAKFVEQLEQHNITFIGPRSSAIKAMGDKIESKRIAESASVNTIPGFVGEIKNEGELLEIGRFRSTIIIILLGLYSYMENSQTNRLSNND